MEIWIGNFPVAQTLRRKNQQSFYSLYWKLHIPKMYNYVSSGSEQQSSSSIFLNNDHWNIFIDISINKFVPKRNFWNLSPRNTLFSLDTSYDNLARNKKLYVCPNFETRLSSTLLHCLSQGLNQHFSNLEEFFYVEIPWNLFVTSVSRLAGVGKK